MKRKLLGYAATVLICVVFGWLMGAALTGFRLQVAQMKLIN
jgi:hypothetical protein